MVILLHNKRYNKLNNTEMRCEETGNGQEHELIEVDK